MSAVLDIRPIMIAAHVERQENGECIVGTSVINMNLETRCAISCGTNWRNADRLAAAINAGHVLTDHRIVKDNSGRRYVISTCRINLIHMSAELRRLGF